MILTRSEILKTIKQGKLKITPFRKKYIGSASIDLTLSNEFRVFKDNCRPITLTEISDYKKYTKLVRKKSIIVEPGDFILAITKEKLTMPNDLCGWLQGRTRFARFGLSIHATAPFISPAVNNRQILEIKNLSKVPLKLKAGTRICQLIIEQLEGNAIYNGKYRRQLKL